MKNDNFSPAACVAMASGDIVNFLAAITPGGIEEQEKNGQKRFIQNTNLPREMNGCSRQSLEKIGVKFGENADNLFVSAQLPDGWKKIATDHSMWSNLLDEKGRKRASIFYKAAFYDQKAHISLARRYSIDSCVDCDSNGIAANYEERTHEKTVVKDGAAIIHVVGVREPRDYETQDKQEALAKAWLDTHFPDWKDATAYWDDSDDSHSELMPQPVP